MARIRYVKPEFFEDTEMAELSRDARLLYIGLWCYMDKNGLCDDNPKLIKRNIFPYDDDLSVERIDALLASLMGARRIIQVQSEGKRYLWCPFFKKHQKIHPGEKTKINIPDSVLQQYLTNDAVVGSISNLQEIPRAFESDTQAVKKCAGIGIGIGTGIGIGIGTGTGTGTGIGTGTPSATTPADPLVEARTVQEAQEKLIQIRERIKNMNPGLGGTA